MASDAVAAIDPIPGRQLRTSEPWSRQRFVRWLTRYDPLPFFSALCVLVGVWLVAGDLGREDWVAGKLALILVTQCYELCLVAGAAVLVRARRLRTAAILGLLEAFFLLDNVFNCHVMPHLETFAWWTSTAWLVLVVVKVEWLVRCLRLRLPTDLRSFLYSTAGLVAFVPQILDDAPRNLHQVVLLAALALATLFLGLALRGFRATDALGSQLLDEHAAACEPAQAADARHRVRRCGIGLVVLWSILLAIHAGSWLAVFDVPWPGYVIVLPALTLLVAARREELLWAAAFWALVASAQVPERPAVELFCFHWAMTALVAYFLVRRAIELRLPRLATPGVLAAAWCLSFFVPAPPILQRPLAYALALLAVLALAAVFREPLAGCIAASMIYLAVVRLGLLDRFGWGVVALSAGFLTLALAVLVQLRAAAGLGSPDA